MGTAASSNRTFYVYEHWRPDTGVCFYVGKGHGKRAYDRRRGRNRHHKAIQAKLAVLGEELDIRIIADALSEDDAFRLEVRRIAYWRSLGGSLANLTDGGDGPSGKVFTSEERAAQSARLKGRTFSAEHRANLSAAMRGKTGRRFTKTDEAKEKTARYWRGRKRTEEQKAKLRAIRLANPTRKGHTHTPEARAAISAVQKGVPKSEAARQNMRGIPKSEAHKQKLRAANLGKKQSAETVARRIESATRTRALKIADIGTKQPNYRVELG